MRIKTWVFGFGIFLFINTATANQLSEHKMATRTVKKIVRAIEQSEGVGARVRRSIGTVSMKNFSPFLMFDDFHSSDNSGGFPEHPHLGQETITYMLSGRFAHEDFTGSKGILHPGDLQFMTAGKGIVHSEMPLASEDGLPIRGMQLWVDLPEQLKESEPRYRDLKAYEIPEVVEQDGKLKIKVISGKSHGVESLHNLAYAPVHYYHYIMKPGSTFEQEVPPDWNFFLYVIKGGQLLINGETKLEQFNNCFFNRDGNTIKGENAGKPSSSGDNDVEFILVGGELLEQEVVQYGPFVATSHERIQKAFTDYRGASNGFENLRTWDSLISNGVTKEMIEGPLKGTPDHRKQEEADYHKNKGTKKDEL